MYNYKCMEVRKEMKKIKKFLALALAAVMVVTTVIAGNTMEASAANEYEAQLVYGDSGWWPANVYLGGQIPGSTCSVAGEGTYTLTFDMAQVENWGSASTGVSTFEIVVLGAGDEYSEYELTDFELKYDGVEVEVDQSLLSTYAYDKDEDGTSDFGIFVYNKYDEWSAANPPFAVDDVSFIERMDVTFTIEAPSTEPETEAPSETETEVPTEEETPGSTVVDKETLVGTAWWTGMQAGKDYAMTDGKVTLTVETSEDAGAFSVEAYTPGYFFTTGSDGNGWLAEGLRGVVSSPFADNNGADPGKFTAGHTYEITVSVDGSVITMEYYDVTAGELMYTMVATVDEGIEIPVLNVHVMAQVGTFVVYESEADVVEPEVPSEEETEAPSEDVTTPSEEETTSKEEESSTSKEEESTTSREEESTTSKEEESTTSKEEETTISKEEESTVAPEEGAVTEEAVEEIQKEAKAEGENVPADAKLVVDNVDTKSDDYKLVTEIIKKEHKDKAFYTLDLKLVKENVAVQPNGKIKVTLPAVEELKDSKMIQVYRIDAGKKTDLGKVEVKNGKFTFETDHFSTYVFVSADENATTGGTTTTPNTGDTGMVVVFMVMAALSAVVVLKKRTVEE